jgi:hypothetical protein
MYDLIEILRHEGVFNKASIENIMKNELKNEEAMTHIENESD